MRRRGALRSQILRSVINHAARIVGLGVQMGGSSTHCHGQFALLRLAKRAYPHWHADASGRSFLSSGSTVAGRALQAHHHGINCWSPELKIIHGKVENANKMKHFTKALLHNLERRLWRCGFKWFLGSARFLWLFMKTHLSKPSRGKDPKLKEPPDCNITVKTFTWVNYFSL